jgi:salicylate hydroxylase
LLLHSGGGIGGLSVAVALAKLVPNHERHIRLDIYESTASLQAQVGAGIGVWPRSWSVLQAMGIDEELLKYTEGEVVDEPGMFSTA